MKTKSMSTEALIIGLLLAPFVYVALIWNQLPADIATHYDLRGNANGWMTKETAVLVIGGLSALIYFLLRYLPQIDPRGRLQSSNYQKLRFVIMAFFAGTMAWLWYMAGHSGGKAHLMRPMFVLLGLMMAGIGNYLTTVKPNFFVGIRTPWTLQSDIVWRKTHQLGGRLMVAGGLLAAALVLVLPASYQVGTFVTVIVVASLIPVIYSYVYFREEKARQLN